MALRVVFDTSVLFSAIGWGGRPFDCLALARSGDITSITCIEILIELAEKLVLKRGMSEDEAQDISDEIASISELVEITKRGGFVPEDPDDEIVIACAIDGKANVVVTGDHHLLSLVRFDQIEIIRAGELLARQPKTL